MKVMLRIIFSSFSKYFRSFDFDVVSDKNNDAKYKSQNFIIFAFIILSLLLLTENVKSDRRQNNKFLKVMFS